MAGGAIKRAAGYGVVVSTAASYPPYSPCPCRSGEKAKFCCLKSRDSWMKVGANVWPKAPRTGKSHPACAARTLADCDDKITREHAISKVLLEQTTTTNAVVVAGLQWQEQDHFDSIGIKALVANVLCQRHNNALSPLDAAIGQFAAALHEFDADFGKPGPVNDVRLFSGEDIERWMLKCLLGLVASKNVGGTLKDAHLGLLYGMDSWPGGGGLYVAASLGSTAHHTGSLDISTLVDAGSGTILGGKFMIGGIPLMLTIGQPDQPSAWGVYRPERLTFTNGGVSKHIEWSWPGPTRGAFLSFTRAGTYGGQPPDWPSWARS